MRWGRRRAARGPSDTGRTPQAESSRPGFLVEEYGRLLLVRRSSDELLGPADIADLTRVAEADDDDTVTVVAGADGESAAALWARLGALIDTLCGEGVRTIRLAMSGAGDDSPGRPAVARRIADSWEVDVVAPDGTVLGVPGGGLFVHDVLPDDGTGGGRERGWWRFAPGAEPVPLGPRQPAPAWQPAPGSLPSRTRSGCVVEQIPAGLLIRPEGARAPRPGDLCYAIPVDRHGILVVVGVPDGEDVVADDVADVVKTLPEAARTTLRFAPGGRRDVLRVGQGAAGLIDAEVVVYSGLPLLSDSFARDRDTVRAMTVGADGAPRWQPFVDSVICAPGASSPRLLRWSPPLPGPGNAQRGMVRLSERWQVTATRAGLWVSGTDTEPPALATRPVDAQGPEIEVGHPGETLDRSLWPVLGRLLDALPPGLPARSRLHVHGSATDGGRELRRLGAQYGLRSVRFASFGRTAQPTSRPVNGGSAAATASTAAPGAADPRVAGQGAARPAATSAPAGARAPLERAPSAPPAAPRPVPTTTATPPADTETPAAPPATTSAPAASVPPVTKSEAPTSATATSATSSGTAASVGATSAGTPGAGAPPANRDASAGRPAGATGAVPPRPPARPAPSSQPAAPGRAPRPEPERAPRPSAAQETAPTTPPTPPSPPTPSPTSSSGGGQDTARDESFRPSAAGPAGAASPPDRPVRPAEAPPRAEDRLPGPGEAAPPARPAAATAPPRRTAPAPVAPPSAPARPLPRVPFLPGHQSSPEERAEFRALAGHLWDRQATVAGRVFTRMPALRGAAQEAALADLVALLLYLRTTDDELGHEELDRCLWAGNPRLMPYGACVASALRRLPSVRGPVLRGPAPAGTATPRTPGPGSVLRSPAPVTALPADGRGPSPASAEYAIWSASGRRVRQLFDGPAAAARHEEVIFAPGTAFRVLDVRTEGRPTPLVLLRELTVGAAATPFSHAPLDDQDRAVLVRLDGALAKQSSGAATFDWPGRCAGPVVPPDHRDD